MIKDNTMKKKIYQHNILILGGGASGIMAAITAARMGADVAILEHTSRIGKKILATGNGKCNLTNSCQEKWCYRSDETDFPFQALKYFSEKAAREFFEELGILLKERNGYWYPYSGQASTILEALQLELEHLRVPIYYEIEIKKIEFQTNRILCFNESTVFQTKNLILAAGSKASPKTGSDGSGYELLKQTKHTLITPVPALVPLIVEGNFKSIAGVRTEAKVTFIENKKEIVSDTIVSDTGELQITEYGLSGIPIFQISRFVSKALEKNHSARVSIDFFPKISLKQLRLYLQKQLEESKKTLEEILQGFFHKKLAVFCIKQADLSLKQRKLTLKEQERLLSVLKNFSVSVKDTKKFEQAQVCAGGVSAKEISPDTMESKFHPNLYFAGELIDVDGACGGYNLQWAWTSGYLAGRCAGKKAGNDIKK